MDTEKTRQQQAQPHAALLQRGELCPQVPKESLVEAAGSLQAPGNGVAEPPGLRVSLCHQ